MRGKRKGKLYAILSLVLFFICWGYALDIQAVPITTTTTTALTTISPGDTWVALPPYNTLWPLWSPPLSPVSSLTGLPQPIVTSLTPATVLPVQPGLTWDPSLGYPWLLYNTPLGLAYFDPLAGVNLWPPRILINTITGTPITLTLPAGYTTLPPTSSLWLFSNVPAANQSFIASYYRFVPINTVATPPSLTSLLTAIQLLI
ncbi:MAG: hypothetical protein K6U11_12050 [bacterium]|nr:hypothetical protein [bacterium]